VPPTPAPEVVGLPQVVAEAFTRPTFAHAVLLVQGSTRRLAALNSDG
jgi:hypothetical protein